MFQGKRGYFLDVAGKFKDVAKSQSSFSSDVQFLLSVNWLVIMMDDEERVGVVEDNSNLAGVELTISW